ncbi:DUF1289 domain-containing protein [Yoonia sp. 2307UL14-13]|uniref:DUF1289 domain-containing protein n=1 Tax=Yoonia sp. 2307UL14-13 TaxID=3126506 RepID=UPI00309B4F78
MAKTPSPCIDVCKFRREGHCIGCSMTKAQKSLFKSLKKGKHREAFVQMLMGQQSRLGKYGHWKVAYLRKCLKKKVKPIPAVRDAA